MAKSQAEKCQAEEALWSPEQLHPVVKDLPWVSVFCAGKTEMGEWDTSRGLWDFSTA